MFTGLIQRLRGHGQEKPLPELDARLAAGALLVRLAKSDAHYAVEEIVEIDRVLAERYSLNPVAAMKMRADCERLSAQAPDTAEFSALVHDAVAYDERVALYETLWKLSLADRKLTPEEGELLESLAHALGINPDDAAAIAARWRS
jgi:uncharacterized tellurite resistance protein B-like protein